MTSTDIVKWGKTNDYENFEKGMIYMKILKKGVGEETKFMPHAPVVDNCLFSFIGYLIYSSIFFKLTTNAKWSHKTHIVVYSKTSIK
jgi:hypothetical protein